MHPSTTLFKLLNSFITLNNNLIVLMLIYFVIPLLKLSSLTEFIHNTSDYVYIPLDQLIP